MVSPKKKNNNKPGKRNERNKSISTKWNFCATAPFGATKDIFPLKALYGRAKKLFKFSTRHMCVYISSVQWVCFCGWRCGLQAPEIPHFAFLCADSYFISRTGDNCLWDDSKLQTVQWSSLVPCPRDQHFYQTICIAQKSISSTPLSFPLIFHAR